MERSTAMLAFIHQFGSVAAAFLTMSDKLTLIGSFQPIEKVLVNMPPIIPGIEIKHKSETANHTRSATHPVGYDKISCETTCFLWYPHEHVFPHLWQRTFLWKILSVPDMSCSVRWGLNCTELYYDCNGSHNCHTKHLSSKKMQ